MQVAICDENQAHLAAYTNILARLPNVTAQTFSSSALLLRWCATHEPHLLIVDYRIPEPDGIACIQRYHRLHAEAETPIILVTTDGDRAVRPRALELGASDFITKPVDAVDFLARCKNLLLLHESRRKLKQRAAALSEEVTRATEEVTDREQETVQRLMRAAEFRDNETGNHIVRMGHYAARLGRALGFSADVQHLLLLAAPMHDIGKVSTPDAILLKPGPLTPAEWVTMKRHARAGYEILAGSRSRLLQLAAQIALAHHERWDGTGYPDGLRGTDIPLEARITAVGDVFDALISDRPFKRAWTIPDAYAELKRRSGTHLDPMVVDAFMQCRADIGSIATEFADQQLSA